MHIQGECRIRTLSRVHVLDILIRIIAFASQLSILNYAKALFIAHNKLVADRYRLICLQLLKIN